MRERCPAVRVLSWYCEKFRVENCLEGNTKMLIPYKRWLVVGASCLPESTARVRGVVGKGLRVSSWRTCVLGRPRRLPDTRPPPRGSLHESGRRTGFRKRLCQHFLSCHRG